jgi:hypothetical protein
VRACRDTFLHFLADNLTGLQVHALRRSTSDNAAGTIQTNAINVAFLKDTPNVRTAQTVVSIDIVYDDELTAVDAMAQVFRLLTAAYYTPKYDYSSGSPVAIGTNVMWNPRQVSFRSIYSDFYFHNTCLLTLEHHPI